MSTPLRLALTLAALCLVACSAGMPCERNSSCGMDQICKDGQCVERTGGGSGGGSVSTGGGGGSSTGGGDSGGGGGGTGGTGGTGGGMTTPSCMGVTAGQDPMNACPGALNCDGNGACRVGLGEICTGSSSCETGTCECADALCSGSGRCAMAACGGCQFADSNGMCTGSITAGQDPKNGCAGALTCDGTGSCRHVPGDGCTSDNDCQSGFCECADATCATRKCATEDCTGAKGCRALGATFGCDGAAFAKDSDPNGACADDCDGAGACEVALGGACSRQAPMGCNSNNCQCANAACSSGVCALGTVMCTNCQHAAANGMSCLNTPVGQDPRNVCTQACNGAGQCQSCSCFDPGVGTICSPNQPHACGAGSNPICVNGATCGSCSCS